MRDKDGTELFIGDTVECADAVSDAEYGQLGTVEYDHEGDMISVRLLDDGAVIDEMGWIWRKVAG